MTSPCDFQQLIEFRKKHYNIKKYAQILLEIICPEKKIKIIFDKSKPNGTPRKVLDISIAKKYGWKSKSDFKQSVLKTYNDYLDNL